MNFAEAGKFLAVTAFVVAFPPVYTSVGKIEGLKLSLAILLLYIGRGILQLLTDAMIKFGRKDRQKELHLDTLSLLKKAVFYNQLSDIEFSFLGTSICVFRDSFNFSGRLSGIEVSS